MRKLIVCGVGLVAALALTVPGAFGGAAQTPGVTAKSITIGGTFPLTGPAASYAPIPLGMKAYFSYINARRATGRRRQARRDRPPDHLEVLRRRLQPGEHGAAHAEARRAGQGLRDGRPARHGAGSRRSRAYLNQQKVPQALVSTGRVLLGHPVQGVPVDDRLAARLHRRGPPLRPAHQGELPREEDRDRLPERRLRQGLPLRLPRGARQAVRRRERRRPGGGRGDGDVGRVDR